MASDARTRSLSGCTTCRIRHSKCDETRPTCQTCAQHGVEFKGYENRIHFSLDTQHTPTDEDATKLRRPLYTEAQRHVMSEELVASTGFKTPSQISAEIDSESALSDPNHSSTKQTGPFGVFSALPLVAASCTDIGLPRETAQLSNDEQEPLSWSPLSIFANDFCGTGHSPCGLSEDALNALGLLNSTLQGGVPYVPMDLDLEDYMAKFSTPRQSPARLSFSSGSDFPEDAPSLLSHYKTAIIPLLSPLRYNRKSPWETSHSRCAMQTSAQSTMKLTPNNAQSAVFYALLPTSAFHLSAVQDVHVSSHWTEMGEKYLTKAYGHSKSSLKNETDLTPKKAKYKDILMAVLSIIGVGMFNGSYANTQALLLDTERLIRLRGLSKNKLSNKVRSLHHCYAMLRIFQESTSVTMENKGMPEESADVRSSHQQATFRISQWDFSLESEMNRPKSTMLGQRDLHLEHPGAWGSTMYIDIYGIPEEFSLLSSSTTRLANEKAIAQIDPSQAKLSWARFSMWTKMLEKCIMSWRAVPRDQPADKTEEVSEELLESNRRFLAHHLQALRQALIIYFYRRVHDVDPGISQDKVEKTLRHSEQCQEEDTRAGTTTATFVWPAFISACEALEPDVQERFIKWFDKSTATTGFSTFKTAKNVCQESWSHRAAVHGQPIDWLQFGRKVHLQLMVV